MKKEKKRGCSKSTVDFGRKRNSFQRYVVSKYHDAYHMRQINNLVFILKYSSIMLLLGCWVKIVTENSDNSIILPHKKLFVVPHMQM